VLEAKEGTSLENCKIEPRHTIKAVAEFLEGQKKDEYTLTLAAEEVFEIDNCLEESWSRLDEDCEMDPEDESLNLREQWVQLEAKVSQLAGQARRNKQAEIASLEKRLASLKGK
jgi:hypothetical protein